MYSPRNGRPLGADGLEDILAFEGSLGIAPAIVALAVPVASKLVGLIAGLFSGNGKPSAAQLQKAKDQAQLWVDRYAEAWAQGDRNRIKEIKDRAAWVANADSYPDYYREYARNTLAVISQHDAQNPTPPAYNGPLIVAIETDNLTPPRRTPRYLLPPAGGAWKQVGTTVVDQPDGTRSTVPVFIRDASAPITDYDTGSGQQAVAAAGAGGGGTFANQAGILGGSGGLLMLALAGTAAYFLLGGNRGR